jgi:hypothetical protein
MDKLQASMIQECLAAWQLCVRVWLGNERLGAAAACVHRRAKYGFNELEKAPGTPLWKLILQQFDDTLVKVSTVNAIAMRIHLVPVAAAPPARKSCMLSSYADPAAGCGSFLWACMG